jgi:hypothetical protein
VKNKKWRIIKPMEEDSIYGISIEKYAEILVKTINAGEDESECKKIIEDEGISYNDWLKTKKEWDYKITDPKDKRKTYDKFLPLYDKFLELYQSAIGRQYFGRPPCTLEEFTRIHCALAIRKDHLDPSKPVKYEKVLKEFGFTTTKWEICNSYWVVRVAMANYRKRFAELVRKYSQ